MKRLLSLTLIVLYSATCASAHNVYVSPRGNDRNDGSLAKPVASFQRAQQLARTYCQREHVDVLFDDGVYYLPQTVVLTPEDNNTTYKAQNPQQAILSGGQSLKLKWKSTETNGLYVAKVKGDYTIDQLYINGERQRMARYPNISQENDCNVYDRWRLSDEKLSANDTDALSKPITERWAHPEGGYIHAMHAYLWGDMHWLITGRNDQGELQSEGGWQNNRPSPMHPKFRIVENIREELDEPGEWYYDKESHLLYYMPANGVDMKLAKVEIVLLKTLISLQGNQSNPVRKVDMEGFVFRHAARTFMENKEPLLRSDWTIYRGGAVMYEGTEDCSLVDCDFDQVGGNTVFVNKYNRRFVAKGCYIHDSGANGFAFVGDVESVRCPMFVVGESKYDFSDFTPGPKTDNYPADCRVEDCIIAHTGRDEKQTAPVQISMSNHITVSHCSIYDVPRAGINISEGTFGGHVIEDCDVFNTVLETGDHGSFNSWGRGRFWSSNTNAMADYVESHPGIELADILAPNIIHHNRWRCDHGWDVDLDDGSSLFEITDNIFLNGGLKMREGYHRMASNNIILNNSLHIHVWPRKSGDIFTHNIVCQAYKPVALESTIPAGDRLGLRLDSNFYACPRAQMEKYLVYGCDSASMYGDPLFVNPSEGEYSVAPNSPALQIGFKNFPMTGFGVVSPRLQRIAKHPVLPEVKLTATNEAQQSDSFTWQGATFTLLTGPALSAMGVSLNMKVLSVQKVDSYSQAEKFGLRKGDGLSAINGKDISSLQEAKAQLNKKDELHTLTVIRSQQKIELNCNNK